MSSNSKNIRRLFAIAVIALFASGCDQTFSYLSGQQTQDKNKEEALEEEGKTAVITVWGDRFEAFIEHDYLIVNTPTKFITHISDLVTLKPRRDGPITFVMKHGEDPAIKQEVPKVARDGIYLPMIPFPKVGTWKVHIEVPLKDKTFKVNLPDVTVFKDEAAVKAAPDPEEIEGVTYLKEQQWKIGTGAYPVARRTLSERLRVTARVAAPLASQAHVVVPFVGTLVKPEKGKIPSIGERVEEGQVLARLRSSMSNSDRLQMTSNKLSAESTKLQVTTARTQLATLVADLDIRLAEAKAKVKEAEVSKEHAEQIRVRVTMLFEKKAKSKKEFEMAQFESKKAITQLEVARTLAKRYQEVRLTLGKLINLKSKVNLPNSTTNIPFVELRAPISGIIAKRHGVVGELVDPTQPVFSIFDPSTVLIKARLPESHLPRLAQSHEAFYERPGAVGKHHSILGQGGRFLYIGLEIDVRSRTVPLIYAVPNKKGTLRIGMTLAVNLETQRSLETMAIPDSAVIDEDGQPIAFVHISGETYEKRELKLGIRDGHWIEVKSGLKPGDRVVTIGAYNIRLASLSTKLPVHGHAH